MLLIMLEYQNIKEFLQKTMFQIGQKKLLWLKKLRILCTGHTLLVKIIEEIVRRFYEKELQKANQKEV